MDTLSHGLYGGIAFGRKSKKDYITAFLFGIGPDILAFGPLFTQSLLGLRPWPRRDAEPPGELLVPHYVYSIYNVTHSLVIYAGFLLVVWYVLKNKRLAILSLAWPLHILVDIPTHSREFFPTPLFWPIANVTVNGIPWAQPIIFIPNVILVITLYLIWYLRRKRNKIEV